MTSFTDDDLALLRQFRQLAGQALADPAYTVGRAAEALCLSERSFYRKFRELTGQTPATYLREMRLDRAHELLTSGAVRSVEEAAFAVGIEDVPYFARLFFKRYRQRPGSLVPPPADE